MKRNILSVAAMVLWCALGGAALAQDAAAPKVAEFEQLLQQVQQNTSVTDAKVMRLYDLARELGRPFAAHVASKAYVSRTMGVSAALTLAGADNARLAGDYRTAVSRYKSYLQTAAPDKAASQAAARLFAVQLDVMDNPDDAFASMSQYLPTLRQDPMIHTFDRWFTEQAIKRQAYAPLAKMLAAVLSEKMPLEKERLYYWESLDWLMTQLSQGQPAMYDALLDARRLVPLVRNDKRRTLRYGLAVALLEHYATAAGKDQAALDKQFASVIAAADAYFKAFPTADTVTEIWTAFAGGYGRWDGNSLGQFRDLKQAWFFDAFQKLDDANRTKTLNWSQDRWNYMASPDQWSQLGAKYPKVFNTNDRTVPRMGFITRTDDPAVFERQATFLKGVPTLVAAASNAMAASRDLNKSLDYLMANETWYLDFTHPWWLLGNYMWPSYASYPEDKRKGLSTNSGQIYFDYLDKYLPKSPMAIFDMNALSAYVSYAWSQAGEDQSSIVKRLDALAWVPLTAAQRKQVFDGPYDQFRKWAGPLQDKHKADAKSVDAAVIARIDQIEQAFKRALNAKDADLSKAPDETMRQLAQAVIAAQAGDQAGYLKVANALYAKVRDYNTRKTPWGRAIFSFLLTNRNGDLDLLDFQAKVIADQFKDFDPAHTPDRMELVMDRIFNGRANWGYAAFRGSDRPAVKVINDALAQGLVSLIDKGTWWPRGLYMFRYTRRGSGWLEQDWNTQVVEKLIEKKVLLNPDYWDGFKSGASYYMYLIRNEFNVLAKQYPVETYFDDMAVEEIHKYKFVDAYIRYYTRDEQQKIRNAVAELFATHQTLPFGYGDQEPAYRIEDYWAMASWSLSAADAVRDKMLDAVEAMYGKTRYDSYAMGRHWFQYRTNTRTAAGRTAFFDHLKTYAQRMHDACERTTPPYMIGLNDIPVASITDAELAVLLDVLDAAYSAPWWNHWYYDLLTTMVQQSLAKRDQYVKLLDFVPTFWRIAAAERRTDLKRDLAQFSRELMDEGRADLAAVYSTVGMEVLGADMGDDVRAGLRSVRSEALLKVGGMVAVPRDDPRYPIFSAQAAYFTGKTQSAWEQYLARPDLVQTAMKDLDVNFLIWLIERNTELRRFDQANDLSRQLLQWIDAAASAFEPETRAAALVAYAGIAMAQKEYPRARAQLERIATAKEFDNTHAQRLAELRIAAVDREMGNFDRAIELLEKLVRRSDRELQTDAYFELALTKYAQEEYDQVNEYLEQVFIRDPSHAQARILQGQVHLKTKKLVPATDVKVGLSGDQKFVVPGRPLKVELEDRNLAVAGAASNIEIKVWTTGGDEEKFGLFPFGDSKTRFTGQINTELAKVLKGDNTLQLRGDDKVHYSFSQGGQVGENQGQSPELIVVSDAELLVSSGEILTDEQREERALEDMIRQRLEQEQGVENAVALSVRRPADQVKPGNIINVRVVDPDRSISDKPDTIAIRVSTSSGDSIDDLLLTETGGHTGVFEAGVPTAAGQAIAFASDSDEGSDPNFVISPGDYPAWVGLPDNVRPKTLSIDLNDNVPLGVMTIQSPAADRRIKDLLVQTSLNGRDFFTVGGWPGEVKPWDGSPRLSLVRYDEPRPPRNLEDFQTYVESTHLARRWPKVTLPVETLVDSIDNGLHGKLGEMKMGNNWYIAHYTAAFYLSRAQVKTFKLDNKGRTQNISYLMAIDGKVGRVAGEFSESLTKGVHRIDVFIHAYRHAVPSFAILTDSPNPPYLVPLPAAMVDPGQNPQIASAMAHAPAKISAENNDQTLKIQFAAGSRARMVRLIMADFESDAPSIDAITLTDIKNQPVLPTRTDYMTLKKNRTLEIVPGDRISAVYEDPKVVDTSRQIHEAFLTATYANAVINACFVEFRLDQQGNRVPHYIPMRRFAPGDVINVFVNDPDMDASDKLDTVQFVVKLPGTDPIVRQALETESHSGIFVGKVFPVAGEPKRDGEVTIKPDQDVLLMYQDNENTDPGVQTLRESVVEQTTPQVPELRVFTASSQAMSPGQIEAYEQRIDAQRRVGEYIPVTQQLVITREPEVSDQPASVLVDGPLVAELTYKTIAQSPESTAVLYAQTQTARDQAGKADGDVFDINLPGTIRLTRRPLDRLSYPTPTGYSNVLLRGNPYAGDPLDDGRFTFVVPLEMGPLPEESFANYGDNERLAREYQNQPLIIKGADTIYLGFLYNDAAGKPQWITRKVELASDVMFHVMDRRYQNMVEQVHVGESVYFRVMHKTRDISDEADHITVTLTTKSGKTMDLELVETFNHSGIFKGLIDLVYQGDKDAVARPGTLAVDYGDVLTATYAPQGAEPMTHDVMVFKGADGQVLPFSKRFADPSIAVETQFTIAEAYFELAKRHRELGQESLVRREIAQGKKLLEEALRDYPETDARAQAEFLLANLSHEYARDVKDENLQRQMFMEAITRYGDIVSTYPDSAYAPKAQFRKALVFEQMGKLDQACDEYVKLSYRYPDNELVAETITRLGAYFQVRGTQLTKQAEDTADAVEKEKILLQARNMYKTAGEVFGRLSERFPNHQLAAKTLAIAGQCFMRAERYDDAVSVFEKVYEDKAQDSELRAEAMYWCGETYMRQEALVDAYRVFKRLSWDFPETKWARFARGRLTDERLVRIEAQDTGGK